MGRSDLGDRQLFEYAFHEGIPLCILADGRDWSFYLPAGQGNYDERRVHRLRLDEWPVDDAARILHRYLNRERVRSGDAHEDAIRDYRDLASPRVQYPPSTKPEPTLAATSKPEKVRVGSRSQSERSTLSYRVFDKAYSARSAKEAFVDTLGKIALRHPQKIEAIAEAARGRTRNHIARSVEQIYPERQDLASSNTAEILDGWLVGLNIANREKVRIIRAACDATGLRFGTDVQFELPNADS